MRERGRGSEEGGEASDERPAAPASAASVE